MDTARLKKFAQNSRRNLMEQVSAKINRVMDENSAARRELPKAVTDLEKAIKENSRDQVVEKVAYTWFNRFCALRFMDVNRYTRIGVVSPAEGQSQPEILAEAKMGHIDESMIGEKSRQKVFDLLNGKEPSPDPQGEAYRLLLVAACNYWHVSMPFMFERINDYTELLMPDDLLSENALLDQTRNALSPDDCNDVEVIGWLYQFYISEKKDAVFDGLKKNKKITPENIPAATQLFTPHWIVRYLVENSLGRLWMLNRPASKLTAQMDYYITPEQPETDFLRIEKPEDIKICDPACGSGHMLTYAFDLLYAIYEEEGHEPSEIPEKILTHNLYGIEIDDRAGALAAFALTMKARSKQRRFFRKKVFPNICVLKNVHFGENELKDYVDFIGRDLFTEQLLTTLYQFKEADNFGSLIRPALTDVVWMVKELESKDVSGQLFLHETHQKVMAVLNQADYLSPKYHVVVANPPYMGVRGMTETVTIWIRKHYMESKADLMTCFMDRARNLVIRGGAWGMINLPSWMFLSTFEKFRKNLLSDSRLISLLHLGRGIFGSDFGSVAFIFEEDTPQNESKGIFRRLFEKHVDVRPSEKIESLFLDNSYKKYTQRQSEFSNIPGSPIAYWLNASSIRAFTEMKNIGNIAKPRQGMSTNDNNRFLRRWFEVERLKFGVGCNSITAAMEGGEKWLPYNKGGEFRRWYGNNEYAVNWKNNGEEIKHWLINNPQDPKTTHWSRRIINSEFFFKEGITWSFVTSGSFGVRYTDSGFLFDVGGSSLFPEHKNIKTILGCLGSKCTQEFLNAVNPTLNFQAGNIASIPYPHDIIDYTRSNQLVSRLITLARSDWDSYETSWGFTVTPLMSPENNQSNMKGKYQNLFDKWQETTLKMQRLEEENNRIFIEAYGLQDELTPEVPLKEITLTCNPHYRYGGDKTEEELEALLLADTMREFISYAVGCMFGRYALEKPGLILANQGETLDDYLEQIPVPSFPADDDNVIPILDGEWFTDDIVARFRTFLKITFGEEHYEENLAFIEQAIGKDLRTYFIRDFYTDHVKRYKKRPIYWLFSSPKGSFNALIYMHRYRPDTVSVVLNDYLREFRNKLAATKSNLEALSISATASKADKTKALKEIEKIGKMIAETEAYERDVLFPLATEKITIDLDDGVKANYPKFGTALKNIPGLEAKDD